VKDVRHYSDRRRVTVRRVRRVWSVTRRRNWSARRHHQLFRFPDSYRRNNLQRRCKWTFYSMTILTRSLLGSLRLWSKRRQTQTTPTVLVKPI